MKHKEMDTYFGMKKRSNNTQPKRELVNNTHKNHEYFEFVSGEFPKSDQFFSIPQ